MENVAQSEEWKRLGLSLEAFQGTNVHDSATWTIKVRRSGVSNGLIQFTIRTRLDYGQLDPYDAFLGLCETFAGLPGDYYSWISLAGLPDTESYRYRFQELQRQKQGTIDVLGPDVISRIANLRPTGEQKRVLPAGPASLRAVNLHPNPGMPMQTP